jgi:DNA topoisomerase-1
VWCAAESFDANDLNKVMKNFMEGLSVKVFRTYNASITLERLLKEQEDRMKEMTVDEKKAEYDHANKEVSKGASKSCSAPTSSK